MLQNKSSKSLVFSLILFSIGGSFLTGTIIAVMSMLMPDAESSIWYLRISILLQDLFVLFLPGFLVFKFNTNRPAYMLGFKKDRNMANILTFAVLAYIVALPATSIMAQWNNSVSFPESLSGLEAIFRSMEESARNVTDRFLSGTSFGDVTINIIIVALAAALVEEVFFRGALQQLLVRWIGHPHVAVWLTAFIFSAIHLQFFGFIPRLFMGAILGYMFYYTKNLWVPILYHFVNNAAVVIMNLYWGDSQMIKNMEEGPLEWYSYIILIVSLLFTYLLFSSFAKNRGYGKSNTIDV